MEGQSPHNPSAPPPLPSSGAASAASGAAGAAAGSSTTQKRRRAPSSPFQTLPRPKKHKLPRNLNSITARNLLPDAPTAGTPGPSGNRGGPRTTKGPYKKREKKDSVKDGGAKKTPGATASGSTSAADGAGASLMTGAGGAGGRRGRTGPQAGGRGGAVGVSDNGSTGPGGLSFADDGDDARADIADGEQPGQEPGEGGVGATGAAGGEGGEAKDEDDDDHEEEPEYSDDEWNQEASARGRSKDELKALLDCFSDEQLQRYEVYRRSVLSRSTVKKLVATILNQQVTQTMAFVVAGFSKVFVGEMVERAREVMEDWGEMGAIRPEHLREAQRRYKKEEVQRGKGVRVPTGYKRRMFCR
ncbi:hypothetical protein BGW38_002169 [Lunasporangiospora selenospora]|uniref:Transcription initiation factor TFIID subunit 11 n=1 Tax=Lunasporangiospora selenospora TaxID=979761 RepID=A0A9P6KDK1_9FUNG|nr:hypothetical protein BGW38_002169 [Lunasporangiospora selenospora]